MKLVSRLFRRTQKSVGQAQTSPSNPWKLVCKDCGAVYIIGEDAQIITQEDVEQTLFEGDGLIGFIYAGTRRRRPELVMRWQEDRALVEEERKEKQRQKAIQIRAALSQGEKRLWRCDRCWREHEHENKYPREFGGT